MSRQQGQTVALKKLPEKSIIDLRSRWGRRSGWGQGLGTSKSPVSPLLLEHLLEQLQDANYNVIDVAEAGGLWEMDL